MKHSLFLTLTLLCTSGAQAGTAFFTASCKAANGISFQVAVEGCANQFDMYETTSTQTKRVLELRTHCKETDAEILVAQDFNLNTATVVTGIFPQGKPGYADTLALIATSPQFTLIQKNQYGEKYSFEGHVSHLFYRDGVKKSEVFPVQCNAESFDP